MNRIWLALLCIMSFSAPVRAQDGQDRLVLGTARYNPTGNQSADHHPSLHVEARLGSVQVYKLQPWLGLELNEDHAAFVGAGLETDIKLAEHIILTLQTGVGYFDDGPEGKSSNSYAHTGVTFRHQAELGYEFDGGVRIGLAALHTSNGGMYKENPGNNQLGINWHLPVNILSGRSKPID